MLAVFRKLPQRPARGWTVAASARLFSSSQSRLAKSEPAESEDPEDPEAENSGSHNKDRDNEPSFTKWMTEGQGRQFRTAHRPCNWLGGDVPFPLNPSFKPPTPVSDRLRTVIWDLFIADPTTNSVRKLAERFGLSLKRIDAILRLKGLEQHWIKKKPIQTGFVAGMEHILGVKETASKARLGMPEGSEVLGEDTTLADSNYDAFGNDEARHRYQRLFWEPYSENSALILPRVLERAKEDAQRHALLRAEQKIDPKLLGDIHVQEDGHENAAPIMVERDNRPAVKFVDVGVKWVDVKDRKRRVQESERRSHLRTKRRLKKLRALEATKHKEMVN